MHKISNGKFYTLRHFFSIYITILPVSFEIKSVNLNDEFSCKCRTNDFLVTRSCLQFIAKSPHARSR